MSTGIEVTPVAMADFTAAVSAAPPRTEHIGIPNQPGFQPAPESLWLVLIECRCNVIRVCASGKGLYIPGQEPCWGFDHVAEWLAEIKRPAVGQNVWLSTPQLIPYTRAGEAELLTPAEYKQRATNKYTDVEGMHRRWIENAFLCGLPVNAEAVQYYQLQVPPNYELKGFVYQRQASIH